MLTVHMELVNVYREAVRPVVDREQLRDWDRQHVWHPYTQMKEYAERDPVIIERGQGMRLMDVNGRWYWDGISSIWLNVHGHRVPQIDQAIVDQLGKVAHSTLLTQANVPSILLAERLARLAPAGLQRVFYSDNGSGAVEVALKLAVQYWYHRGQPGKRKVLSFAEGYHGDTMGAVGIAPVEVFHRPFAHLLPANLQVPYPYCYRCPWGQEPASCTRQCLAAVERLLQEHQAELAAVFMESLVQGVGGIIVMPPGYLRGLRELCTRYNVLLVADEVATGFARTGRLWACEHEDVAPDLLAVGKGITGGYLPLAATLATDEIYKLFLGDYRAQKTFFHGHSYTGNQLACAAALASLDLLQELLPELPAKAAFLARELERFRTLPFVGDVRQQGMMVGLELVADKATKARFPWEDRVGWAVADRARELGLLVRPYASTSIFMPPLAASQADLKTMLDLFWQAHLDVQAHMAAVATRVTGATLP